jgi:curved DNA-binding protein
MLAAMTPKYVDYYQTLGVSRSASPEEIQRAYRQQARKLHPDVNKAHEAETEFKRLGEAYEVLKDPEKRRLYDDLGPDWKSGQDFRPPTGWAHAGGQARRASSRGRPGGGPGERDPGEPVDFSDFFQTIFGGGMGDAAGRRGSPMDDEDEAFGRPFGRSRGPSRGSSRGMSRGPAAGEDLRAEVSITLADAYHSGTRRLTLEITDEHERRSRRHFDVRVPPGVHDGGTIRLSGQGFAGERGGPSGDALLTVRIAPDPRYSIAPGSRHDLVTTLNVSPWEAALGAKVPLTTFGGEVMLTVPAGTSSGQRLRIRGQGLPKNSEERGDLFVELRVVVPKALEPDEKLLFEQLAATSNFDPRQA